MEQYLNLVFATLASGINDATTTLPLTTGHGARFGTITAGNKIRIAFLDASKNVSEVAYMTAITSDTATITRGQDGTTACAHLAGDRIEARIGKSTMDGLEQTVKKDATGGYAGLTLFKINFKNALDTFTSWLTNSNTAARTYTFQDRDGTIADLADVQKLVWVDGGGTADAITATYAPALTALVDGQLCCVRATAANATATPTFSPNGLTARTIVKTGGAALIDGDISGDGHELILRYDLANTRWELLNPKAAAGVVKFATGANIASASTINLSTATGNLVHITGTTAITAVTMTSGQWMRCIADGALPLTYHATTNRISGGVNYTCTAGDTIDYYYDGTTVFGNITKKNGTSVIPSVPVGGVVQTVEGTPYASATSTASAIPLDSSIPQITEGTEYVTCTITPKSATNRLRIECDVPLLGAGASIYGIAALFQDSTADALAVTTANIISNGIDTLSLRHEMAAGTTSATTFRLRIGPSSGTLYVNQSAVGNTLGGIQAIRMRVIEIQA